MLVTRTEAKAILRVRHSHDDDLVDMLVAGAEGFVQEYCGVFFGDEAADLVHTEDLDSDRVRSLLPRFTPINSVTSVTDNDSDDAVVDADTYRYSATRIFKRGTDSDDDSHVWERGYGRWRAAYNGGYLAATLPAGMKAVILQLVYRAFWGRGGKSRQAAAGHGYSFRPLLDSDMAKELTRYKSRAGRGGLG